MSGARLNPWAPEATRRGSRAQGRHEGVGQHRDRLRLLPGAARGKTEATLFTFRPIGFIRSPFTDTQEIPKGPGAKHDAEGTLELLPEFEEGLADIEGFSHLYVLWIFDRAEASDLTAHPPIDDRPHGVFATRSPRRPNPIGLTVVRLLRRDGVRLFVRGVDMLDGSPIVDLKPYLSSVPVDEIRRGWITDAELRHPDRIRAAALESPGGA